MKIVMSVSKGKKPKNNRSQLLSALMKGLGGDTGDSIANAFVGSDVDAFKSAMSKIVEELTSKMPNASK